jgi:hypothetical protein
VVGELAVLDAEYAVGMLPPLALPRVPSDQFVGHGLPQRPESSLTLSIHFVARTRGALGDHRGLGPRRFLAAIGHWFIAKA